MKETVFLINGLRGGGAEKVCVNLANDLSEFGCSITIVVLNLRGAAYSHLISSQVKFISLDVADTKRSFLALRKILNMINPKVVLAFNSQLAVLLLVLRPLLKQHFCLIARNSNFISSIERQKKGLWHGLFVKWLIRRVYRKSDLFIAQTELMKLDMSKYLGVDEDRIYVINNPISKQVVEERERVDFTNYSHRSYLLCVGRLEQQKGFEFAIKAFSELYYRYPYLKLKIVGVGSQEQTLKKLSCDLGVSDRVEFEGFQSDIFLYYSKARCTVLTSRFEGFPNVLLESIAMGTPVVAFNCPSGPSEIVINDVNGYLVQPKDTPALVAAIEKSLSKPWDYVELIKSVEKFNREAIARLYKDVLTI